MITTRKLNNRPKEKAEAPLQGPRLCALASSQVQRLEENALGTPRFGRNPSSVPRSSRQRVNRGKPKTPQKREGRGRAREGEREKKEPLSHLPRVKKQTPPPKGEGENQSAKKSSDFPPTKPCLERKGSPTSRGSKLKARTWRSANKSSPQKAEKFGEFRAAWATSGGGEGGRERWGGGGGGEGAGQGPHAGPGGQRAGARAVALTVRAVGESDPLGR